MAQLIAVILSWKKLPAPDSSAPGPNWEYIDANKKYQQSLLTGFYQWLKEQRLEDEIKIQGQLDSLGEV